MKNIISFDVGMKNLAYCLFQIGDDANNLTDYKILDEGCNHKKSKAYKMALKSVKKHGHGTRRVLKSTYLK